MIAHVLATRGTDPHPDTASQVRSAVAAAAVLALTDTVSARQMLRDIESRSGLDSARFAGLAGDRRLKAWALVDPEHAETLFVAELTAFERRSDVDLRPTGFVKMAQIMATPPARREAFLRGEIGDNWHPSQ